MTRPPPIGLERKEPPLPRWARVLLVVTLGTYSVLFVVLSIKAVA